MTDAEIRGRLLIHFHRLRHSNGGWVPITDGIVSGLIDSNAVYGVCQQLADAGLIAWKPLKGGSGGFVAGMALITGAGVDVVERNRQPPIEIRFGDDLSNAKASSAIQIVPTHYPEELGGEITIQNPVIIDKTSSDFRAFLQSMEKLTDQLKVSNSIAGETRDQLLAEIKAGLAILEAPKPDPQIIDLYLKRPLLFIAKKFADAMTGALATAAVIYVSSLV